MELITAEFIHSIHENIESFRSFLVQYLISVQMEKNCTRKTQVVKWFSGNLFKHGTIGCVIFRQRFR